MIPLKQYIKDYPVFFTICLLAVILGVLEDVFKVFPTTWEGYFAAGFFFLLYIIAWAIDSAKVKE